MEGFSCAPVQVNLNKPLHIGIVGSIAWHKGWGVVKALCEWIDQHDLPVRVTVIGSLVPDFSARCLTVTGRYPPQELSQRLAASGANVFLFTSIWPETFSYVAHEIIACGLPLASFDLGAPADALRNYAKGRVLNNAGPARLLADLEDFLVELRAMA